MYRDPKLDLTSRKPRQGTIYSNVLHCIMDLSAVLINRNALYVPGNQFEGQLKLDMVDMNRRRGAGTYYISGKLGRTTDLPRRLTEYPPSTNGIVTVFYDGLPGSVLSDITSNLRSVNEIVSGSFSEHDGGFSSFILDASYNDAAQWEDRSGGMSIFFAFSLFAATKTTSDDIYFGGPVPNEDYLNNSLMAALQLSSIESSQQLNWEISHEGPAIVWGAAHEMFYSNILSDFVISADQRVERDAQGRFKQVLETITQAELSDLNMIQHPHSVSWQPNLSGFFSIDNLNDSLLKSAKLVVGRDVDIAMFDGLEENVKRDAVEHFGELLDCDLTNVADQSLADIAAEAFESCKKDGEESIIVTTPLIYDTLTGVHNSKAMGKWKDPFDRPTDRESGSYNPRASYGPNDRKQARHDNRESIKALKADADSCIDRSNVHYTFMVSFTLFA